MIRNDKIASTYVPDEYFENKTPDRAYLMNIVNTLYPDYMEQIINHAAQQRFGKEHKDDKEHKIFTTDKWMSELSQLPFYSSK